MSYAKTSKLEKVSSPTRPYILLGSDAQELNLRNFVTQEIFKVVARNVFKTGHSVKVLEEVCGLRRDLGLSSLPPTTLICARSLAEVKAIMEKTGLDKTIITE